jgi:tripartite-type tricarboxylate transporter receptor subunit TctC
MKNQLVALLALFAATAAVAVEPARADDANFYAGKTIHLIVGIAPGAGYDLNARILARYMSDYIPGHPTIVVQNQPGAASMIMVVKLMSAGPFDGLTMGATFAELPTEPLLEPKYAHFDTRKLNWIGSTASIITVNYAWHTSPVHSIKDLETHQLLVGAQTPGTAQFNLPTLAAALFGLQFKVIPGYDGSNEMMAAMERGELGGTTIAYSSIASLHPDWLKDGTVIPLLQWGPKKAPGYENIPNADELAKTPDDKEMLKVEDLIQDLARPFFLPPNVPADRVAILRRAFDATVKDPRFLADEQKLSFDVDPTSGEQMSAMIDDAYKIPQAQLDRLQKILSGSGG